MRGFDSPKPAAGAALIVCVFSVALSAQTPPPPAPAQPPVAAAAPPPSPDAPPMPAPNYTYSPDSRRDPFLSLLNRGTADTREGKGGARPDGIAGLSVEEIAVRGIVFTRGAWVAMIGAPNGRTYTLRAGDRLMDGSVRAINGQMVILLQEVNDPLSLEKQREVRKYLRGEAK